ncbi:hypothetical protein [Acrocarpospora catenulata]|uniref:hypothetical protein n=1 Tax=Acrocarpospora catenulata TaxID=2836182 RepID=UPI001BDB1261|nr:hypothetical protein [Acrocarpospora catenulata]
MKRRKAVQFYSSDGGETYTGDCPRWIATTRYFRPDLGERTVIVYGKGPWPCACSRHCRGELR